MIGSSLTRPWTVTKRYGRDPKEELVRGYFLSGKAT
jgi:hypothetical protein